MPGRLQNAGDPVLVGSQTDKDSDVHQQVAGSFPVISKETCLLAGSSDGDQKENESLCCMWGYVGSEQELVQLLEFLRPHPFLLNKSR